MKKNAFTLLELTMVIVVIGIIAVLAIPRMERDTRQESEANLITALRYTQNLALIDNKTDPGDPDWQQELWQLRFDSHNGDWFYTISSDADHDNIVDKNETTVDPINGKLFFNSGDYEIDSDESPNIFLSKKYGINSITMSDSCSNSDHIAFDHLGRPHASLDTGAINSHWQYASYLKTECTITIGFVDSDTDQVITIQPETGHISSN